MRNGFTTGSCAAAAAKAAAYMLFSGCEKNEIKIMTPAGIMYETKILDIKTGAGEVSCAVKKDSGDDPDITNGILVYAGVKYTDDGKNEISIDGGKGVGRVTRDGLDQPKGNAAINSVPRKMIEKEVREVMDLFDVNGSISVTVFVPEGEEVANKTFNSRLGIEGGISIIGTSGIVEPMSIKAILDTIRLELNVRKEAGDKTVVIAPGNYGLDFIKKEFDYDLDKAVKCSNYIGDTIDIAVELGFKKIVLVGHIGKLVKVSGGIMNTHSKEADCRMELMALAGFYCGLSSDVCDKIMGCISTDEATDILIKTGKDKEVFEYITKRIYHYLNLRSRGEALVECIVFSNKYGLLGKSQGAEEIIRGL